MFDPYYKWLGIPPRDQPPNHYRLLGLQLFEPDMEVIDAAANRQMAYVQQRSTGEHAAASQKLLNELSAARLCLLDSKKKAAYDWQLDRQGSPAHRSSPASSLLQGQKMAPRTGRDGLGPGLDPILNNSGDESDDPAFESILNDRDEIAALSVIPSVPETRERQRQPSHSKAEASIPWAADEPAAPSVIPSVPETRERRRQASPSEADASIRWAEDATGSAGETVATSHGEMKRGKPADLRSRCLTGAIALFVAALVVLVYQHLAEMSDSDTPSAEQETLGTLPTSPRDDRGNEADSTPPAETDVFHLPAGQTSLQTVLVGDPGNAADSTGYGAVAYNYQIGKYDVTNAQYCKFLNAKAASSDPYRLWHSDMGSDANGGIERSGGGPYQYAVKPGQDNQPLVDVTWYNAVRFVNWLTNGQGNGGTENGTYEITSIGPDWTAAVPDASQRAKWAGGAKTYWLLPSEDEWYKAAYYKGGGAHAGYWKYPTQHNTPPISTAPPGGSNTANFCDSTTGYAVTGSTNYNSRWNYLTDVGSYPYSVGVYGTLDQGGNVWQWNDTLIDVRRGLRGGAWVTARSTLGSAFRYGSYPTHRSISIGLRVARIGGLPVAAGQSPIGE